MNVLVTGITSGLGKYLYQQIPDAVGWKRGEPLPTGFFDLIIHCAHDLHSKNPHENEAMITALLSIPCDKFVYISSLDIYKALAGDDNTYARSKLNCEQIVRFAASDYLILRCSSLLGHTMRPNSVVRAIKGEKVTVSSLSTFAFVHYDTVKDYVLSDWSGIYLVSGNAVGIQEVVTELKLPEPEYGDYTYNVTAVRPIVDSMAELKKFIAQDLKGKAA